jgi:hypothetical protein
MDGQLLKTIDELGVTVASSQDSVGDEELVAAASFSTWLTSIVYPWCRKTSFFRAGI